MTRPDVAALVAVLGGEHNQLRAEGIAHAIDHALAQPIAELVDLGATRDIILDALTEENLELVISRHVKPGWKRYAEAASSTDVPIGAFVPDEARGRIRDTVQRSRIPRGKWAEGAVDPVLFRRLFAPVFAQLLLNFARRMPIPGVAAAEPGASQPPPSREGGLAGKFAQRVQKRAGKLVDVGRSAMGGLGAEMERRIQATVREFSEGAVTLWRDALKERLKSEEGRALVGQISQQATDHVMVTGLRDIHADAERVHIEGILDVVPAIVAHAAPHAFVRGIVTRELEAFIAVEGARPARELLAELGLLQDVRKLLQQQADRHTRTFLETDAFADWLARVLDAASPP